MCTETYHNCAYCKHNYPCALSNETCPTINFDDDKKLCNSCRDVLEDLLNEKLVTLTNWKLMLSKFVS